MLGLAPELPKTSVFPSAVATRLGKLMRERSTPLYAALGCIYLVTVHCGVVWELQTATPALFWPSAGISAGAMIAFGRDRRASLALLEFGAVTLASLTGGLEPSTALVYGVFNPLESLVVVALVDRLIGSRLAFERLPDLIGFVGAAFLGAIAGGFGLAAALALSGASPHGFLQEWRIWFEADFVGILTFAPVMLLLPTIASEGGRISRFLEGVALLAVFAWASVLIYANAFPIIAMQTGALRVVPTSTFLFPVVIWIAVRTPAIFSGAAVFIMALVIVYCTTHDIGRFGGPQLSDADGMLASQIAMATFAIASLAIATLFRERYRAEASLMDANAALSTLSATLENRVQERTGDLSVANRELTRQAIERERVTAELRQSEAWLRSAQRVAGVGSFSLGAGAHRHWSDEARRIFGFAQGDLGPTIDGFVETLVVEADKSRVAEALKLAMVARHSTSIEYRIQRRDGSVRSVLTAVEPEAGSEAAGEVALLCTALDVTDRNAAEEKIAEYRNELLHVVRVATAGELASVMAHEVNQPLSAVSHTASALIRLHAAGRLPPEDLSEHLAEIATQAQRASAIIRQIRQFVQKRAVAAKPLDVNAVIRDVIGMLEPLARRLDVTLVFEAGEPMRPIVGEEVQIGQIFVNLVRNAIDAVAAAAPERRRVLVTTKFTGEHVVVEVLDHGPGISRDVKARMFEPFFTTKGDGLGMGLPISKTIAEAHGARLEALETDGAGALFRVYFPVSSKLRES